MEASLRGGGVWHTQHARHTSHRPPGAPHPTTFFFFFRECGADADLLHQRKEIILYSNQVNNAQHEKFVFDGAN